VQFLVWAFPIWENTNLKNKNQMSNTVSKTITEIIFHGEVYSLVVPTKQLSWYTGYWFDLIVSNNHLVGVVITGGISWLHEGKIEHEVIYENLETKTHIETTFLKMISEGYLFYRRPLIGQPWGYPSFYRSQMQPETNPFILPAPLLPHPVVANN
jgi:uncharacterized membrane protein